MLQRIMVIRKAEITPTEITPFRISLEERQGFAPDKKNASAEIILFLILEGRDSLNINSKTVPAQPGLLGFLTPDAYAVEFPAETRLFILSIDPGFFRDFVQQNLKSLPKTSDNVSSWTTQLPQPMFEEITETLQNVFEDPLFRPCLTRLGLQQLILSLLSFTRSEELYGLITSAAGLSRPSPAEILLRHLEEDLDGTRMAELVNMSLSSLNRHFKTRYDQTPVHWLKERRLDKARRQILLTDKNMTEIALECGFKDPSHFSRAFKESYGQTPNEFRENRRS